MRVEIDTKGLFNKLIWLIIAGSLTFAAKKANDMSNNLAELNYKIGSIMTWQLDKDETLKDHEVRIRQLERTR